MIIPIPSDSLADLSGLFFSFGDVLIDKALREGVDDMPEV